MDDLTEVIADARAEEEVRAKAIEEKIKEVKETMGKVTIGIEEYVALRSDAVDLRRLIEAISASLGVYKWSGELKIENEKPIIDTMTVLYRDYMDGIRADLLDAMEKEEEKEEE